MKHLGSYYEMLNGLVGRIAQAIMVPRGVRLQSANRTQRFIEGR